jgi:hypothetical protein
MGQVVGAPCLLLSGNVFLEVLWICGQLGCFDSLERGSGSHLSSWKLLIVYSLLGVQYFSAHGHNLIGLLGSCLPSRQGSV